LDLVAAVTSVFRSTILDIFLPARSEKRLNLLLGTVEKAIVALGKFVVVIFEVGIVVVLGNVVIDIVGVVKFEFGKAVVRVVKLVKFEFAAVDVLDEVIGVDGMVVFEFGVDVLDRVVIKDAVEMVTFVFGDVKVVMFVLAIVVLDVVVEMVVIVVAAVVVVVVGMPNMLHLHAIRMKRSQLTSGEKLFVA
jgi:hypothetical protein